MKMETTPVRKGRVALGKSLDALFSEMDSLERVSKKEEREVFEVRLEKIKSSKDQPRLRFNEEKLKELATSIKEKGIIQPIIVKAVEDSYQVIAGERRLRAAKLAGLEKIPVIIKEVSSNEALEIALIENIQREDLNPIEEAKAYQRLIEEFNLTQEELAHRVGKDRSSIANFIRLLKLPLEIQEAIEKNLISMGHARALAGMKSRILQKKLFHKIIKRNLSVRQVEEIIKKVKNVSRETKKEAIKDPFIKEYEKILMESLGTKVIIKENKDKRSGRIEIIYFSLDDIERIIERLR
jgi:ParB family chromosome partitioning protein